MRFDIRVEIKSSDKLPTTTIARIKWNSCSNALFLSVRIPLVVCSTTTAPITWPSIKIGCAADKITALLSLLKRQSVLGVPCKALSKS